MVSGPGSGDTLLPWSPPAMMTHCPGDTVINDNWPPAPGTCQGELETDWEEVNANFVVLLNIWVVQWPGVFHSRLLIIFRDFKLRRRDSHRVESCSVFRSQSQEPHPMSAGANNDYPHIGGHQTLKQIRNLFKRAMINSDFGTIEQLLFLQRIIDLASTCYWFIVIIHYLSFSLTQDFNSPILFSEPK